MNLVKKRYLFETMICGATLRYLRDGVVIKTLASRPIGPGFNSGLTEHYHHVAAVGKQWTLNIALVKEARGHHEEVPRGATE